MEAKELLIYPNKNRIRLMFASGFVFILLGGVLIYYGFFTLGIILVVAGVFNLYINFSKAFLDAPVLTINETGIKDNMNFPSLGKIEWENIKEARIEDFTGIEHIIVTLHDPEKHISQQGMFKRWSMRSNQKNLGTCVMFRTNVFPEKKQKVLDLINRLAKVNQVSKKVS